MRSFGLNTPFSHFSFSHFPTEKLENEKIRTNFLIFSFSHFPIYPWTNEKMRKLENEKIQHDFRIFAFPIFEWKNGKIRSLISDFPLIGPNHRYFHYVIFTSYLDVYLIWPPCPNQQKHCEVKFPIFQFSHISIFPWKNKKMRNGKMRKFGQNFSFSTFFWLSLCCSNRFK